MLYKGRFQSDSEPNNVLAEQVMHFDDASDIAPSGLKIFVFELVGGGGGPETTASPTSPLEMNLVCERSTHVAKPVQACEEDRKQGRDKFAAERRPRPPCLIGRRCVLMNEHVHCGGALF